MCAAGAGALGARPRHRLGRHRPPTTTASATTSRGSCRASSDFNERVREPGGFTLPHPPRDSRTLPDRHAARPSFTVNHVRADRGAAGPAAAADGPLATTSTTRRSTASTTATAASSQGRRVVFVQPDDLAALGLADGDDGRHRQRVARRRRAAGAGVPGGRATPSPPAPARAYFPEANVLVPLDSTADAQRHADLEVGRRPLRPHLKDRPGAERQPGPSDSEYCRWAWGNRS